MEEKIAMFALAHIKLWTVIYQFQGYLGPGISAHLNIANDPSYSFNIVDVLA